MVCMWGLLLMTQFNAQILREHSREIRYYTLRPKWATFHVWVKFVLEKCRVCGDDLIYWTKTLQLSFSSLFGVENWRGWLWRRNDLLLSTIRCQRLLPLSGGPPDRLRAVIISATYTEQASIKFDGFSLFASATLNLLEISVNIFLFVTLDYIWIHPEYSDFILLLYCPPSDNIKIPEEQLCNTFLFRSILTKKLNTETTCHILTVSKGCKDCDVTVWRDDCL